MPTKPVYLSPLHEKISGWWTSSHIGQICYRHKLEPTALIMLASATGTNWFERTNNEFPENKKFTRSSLIELKNFWKRGKAISANFLPWAVDYMFHPALMSEDNGRTGMHVFQEVTPPSWGAYYSEEIVEALQGQCAPALKGETCCHVFPEYDSESFQKHYCFAGKQFHGYDVGIEVLPHGLRLIIKVGNHRLTEPNTHWLITQLPGRTNSIGYHGLSGQSLVGDHHVMTHICLTFDFPADDPFTEFGIGGVGEFYKRCRLPKDVVAESRMLTILNERLATVSPDWRITVPSDLAEGHRYRYRIER